jgi:hypothetical protein
VNAFPKSRAVVRNLLLVGCGCGLFAGRALGTPSEEIARALEANSVSDVSQAHPRQVVRAFAAVTFRVQPRDLPDYVIAAINLRPDLAPNIVAVAVKATVKRSGMKPESLCLMIERIVRAAIAADPSAAVSIARAAASASPNLRRCVISAAVAAAPQAKDRIVEATTQTVPLAFLTLSVSDEVGVSSWTGTLNSSNIFDVGNSKGVINSPEQPPAH